MGIHITSLKIAIIGCGAIVENNHLPAISKMSDVRVAWFVDKDLSTAKVMGRRFKAGWSQDIGDIPDTIKTALVAVPNHMHAGISSSLLEQGFDVLCEKPMAISEMECPKIKATAIREKRIFAVVHQFRLLSSILELKRMLTEERIGSITAVDLAFGCKFAWKSRTSFYLIPEYAGGGAMMDLGCHLLDLAIWLLGDIRYSKIDALFAQKEESRMDAAATVSVVFKSGIVGTIRVSRISQLGNAITVKGTNGYIRASLEDQSMVVNIRDSALCCGNHGAKLMTGGLDPFIELWKRFAASCKDRTLSNGLCSAEEATKVVRIISSLYEKGRFEKA